MSWTIQSQGRTKVHHSIKPAKIRRAIRKKVDVANTAPADIVQATVEYLCEAGFDAKNHNHVVSVFIESHTMNQALGTKGAFERVHIHFDENLLCIERRADLGTLGRRPRDNFKIQFDLNDPDCFQKLVVWLIERRKEFKEIARGSSAYGMRWVIRGGVVSKGCL